MAEIPPIPEDREVVLAVQDVSPLVGLEAATWFDDDPADWTVVAACELEWDETTRYTLAIIPTAAVTPEVTEKIDSGVWAEHAVCTES